MASIWSKVLDTNVSHWDYEDFKERMVAQNLPLLAKRMLESGLAHVVGFPSIVQCYELVLECARHYDSGTQRIVNPQGIVLANLNPISITQTFDMLDRSHVVEANMETAKRYHEEETVKSQQIINSWFEKKKSHFSKLLK